MAALADSNMTETKLDALQEAARARNVALSIYRVAKRDDIVAAIDAAHASRATALNVLVSPLLYIRAPEGAVITTRILPALSHEALPSQMHRNPALLDRDDAMWLTFQGRVRHEPS
jgi:hypothetical protein